MATKTITSEPDKEILVTRTIFNQTTEESESIKIRPFATEPARVRVARGRVINLGNYSSARLEVSIEMPCYKEEVVDCYRALTQEVEQLFGEEVSKILGISCNQEQDLNSL